MTQASKPVPVSSRSGEVDKLVLSAFESTQPKATLIAVGGYGRRELFPYSDVDLLLLVDNEPDAALRGPISELLRILWDGGMRVSQSVRTIPECCEIQEGNLELTISLLDRRYLCGDPLRHEVLERRFPRFLHSQKGAIANHLCAMTRGRHGKYGNTIYHLEPNVKESPGGLRDLHAIHWLGLLRGASEEPLASEREFLFSVRTALHEFFGRDNNLLSFDAQDAISTDPAAWMRQYYRNARGIFRAVNRSLEAAEESGAGLIVQFRDWRTRLSTPEFTVSRERVFLREPHSLESDTAIVLRLMQFIARHRLRLAPDTERRIRSMPPESLRAGVTWHDFGALLALPYCSVGLRALHDTGALQALIPEWGRIDCLVVRDFYHRYTVDEHTLVALQSLDELEASKDPLRRRFADLLSEIDRPEALRLAMLLHDIGKGGGTGEHVPESVRIAESAMERLRVPAAERNTVLFLIRHHLLLSSILNSRDLSDPNTARDIAERTATIEQLKLLTLLSYADISAVNPTAMTPWRLEQLWLAYLAGCQEFTKELETDRIHSPAIAPDLAEFVEGFPVRYLRTHSEQEIRLHDALRRECELSGVGVELRRLTGSYCATVVARDRPFLLASLSGALASFGMNILKAEAFANRHGLVLDTFVFVDPHRTLELNPPESDRLLNTLTRAALGKVDVEQLLRNRPKRSAAHAARVQPSVAFNNQVSDAATLIEIVAEDRPGLLHDLTHAISKAGCNIEVVLIDTEAHKALDVFYVTANGRKVTEEIEHSLRDRLLGACRS